MINLYLSEKSLSLCRIIQPCLQVCFSATVNDFLELILADSRPRVEQVIICCSYTAGKEKLILGFSTL